MPSPWVKALHHASRGESAEALAVISAQPEPRALSWRLLGLQVLRANERWYEAVKEARTLLAEVQAATIADENTRTYLLAYVSWMGGSSAHQLDETADLSEFLVASWDIDLAAVPKHLRRNFPLRSHKEWSRKLEGLSP